MMVNSSSNINKTNNNLSTQIIAQKNTTYGVGNADAVLWLAHICGGVKQVNGTSTFKS
jgi:hypothetical protein